jgi:hypothetical protein
LERALAGDAEAAGELVDAAAGIAAKDVVEDVPIE